MPPDPAAPSEDAIGLREVKRLQLQVAMLEKR